ncbi:uncharacterized protein LOC131637881 [Vicia villosa]|uniref:uncharacterized protein LOC131637881 n=1 Tax=Vicia villosa TaxID=3911 RepID=UPI00273CD65F|nr:uncharacterized protein LOC131637881 [Vicia villosa]
MDQKRSIKKYTFRNSSATEMKELATLVPNLDNFKNRYGKLISILKTKVEKGILETLVQFYDPMYHCFTFPDYQLMPTLEEYSYWIGLPVTNDIPFSGLEKEPQVDEIAELLHLKISDVKANMTKKGGIWGLTSKFLIGKASMLASKGSMIAFETFLALLIYGLILFPNIDNFVDVNAIRIFMIGNPVPTLLGDTYHSIHHRNDKKGGLINCCTPLLYKWFISHLPQAKSFLNNPDGLSWSQKIMPLINGNIHWYNPAYDIGEIIDSCGEFPNVPLLGIQGGITYNPILVRRQFCYPMKERPANILVSGIFYLNQDGNSDMRNRFVRAWHHVDRKRHLGTKQCVALKDYTDWVQARAHTFQMPYLLEEPSLLVTPPLSSTTPVENSEEHLELVAKLRAERDALEFENKELKIHLKEKDEMLDIQDGWLMEKDDQIRHQEKLLQQHGEKRKRQQEDSVAWKEVADKLMVENAHLKAFYEDELEKLRRKLQRGDGSSSEVLPFSF